MKAPLYRIKANYFLNSSAVQIRKSGFWQYVHDQKMYMPYSTMPKLFKTSKLALQWINKKMLEYKIRML